MAITNIGLSEFSSTTADSTKRFLVSDNKLSKGLYLKWRTASGADVNKSFDIALNYRVVPKVTTEGGAISGWATDWGTWANVLASKCSPRAADGEGGYQWSINFASLLGMETVGLLSLLFKDGKLDFENRYYDRIEFGIRIKSHYEDGVNSTGGGDISGIDAIRESPRTDDTFILDFVPNYTIQGVYCDSLDAVKIEYACSGLWLRTDDRFCVESMMMYDKDGKNGVEIAASKPWGTVSLDGDKRVLAIPTSALSDMPLGELVTVDVRFNPSYGTSGEEFATASLAAPVPCQGGGNANTPLVMLANPNTNGVLKIKAIDSGENIKPITHCFVKLSGSNRAIDQKVVPINEWVPWHYAPKGVPLTFVLVGVAYDNEKPLLSHVVKANATVKPLAAVEMVSMQNPSVRALARYDLTIDSGYVPNKETIKLAGRPLPCSYYGEGGTYEWGLSFSVPPAAYLKSQMESVDAWLAVAAAGDCMMLLKDGKRAVVSFERFRPTRSKGSALESVSASLVEVEL